MRESFFSFHRSNWRLKLIYHFGGWFHVQAQLVHDDGAKIIVHAKIQQPMLGNNKLLMVRSHVCPGDPIEPFDKEEIWVD